MMALQSRWPTQLSSTTEKSWAAWRVSLTKRKNTTRSFTAECSCFDSTILSPFVCRTRATITWEREIVSLGHLCSTMLKTKGVGKGRVFVSQSTLTTLLHREFVLRVISHWWSALICKWKQGALNCIAEFTEEVDHNCLVQRTIPITQMCLTFVERRRTSVKTIGHSFYQSSFWVVLYHCWIFSRKHTPQFSYNFIQVAGNKLHNHEVYSE